MKKFILILLFLGFSKAFSQPYSTAPSYSLQSTRSGENRLQWVNNVTGIAWNPYNIFLPSTLANTLYKPIGYVPGWNEITGKPDFSQFLTSSYTGFDSRYKLANYNPSRAEILSGLGYTPYDGAVNPLGFLNNGSLNGYATQNYVNSQGFLTSAPVPSVFNRTGAIAANQTDYQAFYPLLSNAYNDPGWINSLAGTKITGLGNGAFLNASINSSPNLLVQRSPTGSIAVNEIDASYLRALFPTETALLPNSILGIYSEPGMKSAARAFPLSTIAQSLQLGTMAKEDPSRFIKREYLQDMASFNKTGQFTGSSTDPANPLSGVGSTGLGVSVLSMFEGPDNGSYFIAADGYNTNTHRYYDAFGSLYANGAWHTSHFLLDNNFRDYVYSKGYIDTALNNLTLPAGTAAQYIRGDKTPQILNTTVVPEGTNIYFTTARARTSFTGAGGITINQLTGVITGASGGTNGFNFDVSADTGAQLTANNTITFPHHLTGYSAGSVIVGNCYDLGTAWALSYNNCKMDATNIIIAFRSAVDLNSVMSFGFQITK